MVHARHGLQTVPVHLIVTLGRKTSALPAINITLSILPCQLLLISHNITNMPPLLLVLLLEQVVHPLQSLPPHFQLSLRSRYNQPLVSLLLFRGHACFNFPSPTYYILIVFQLFMVITYLPLSNHLQSLHTTSHCYRLFLIHIQSCYKIVSPGRSIVGLQTTYSQNLSIFPPLQLSSFIQACKQFEFDSVQSIECVDYGV